MAAFAGLLNHQMTAGQALTGKSANPMAAATAGTSSTGSSASSSATISASDFLTLLVTEMQNQDPTADTDPNEYIDQLVQVNSLEQLISINQNLSTALGDSGSTSSDSTGSARAGVAKASVTGASQTGANPAGASPASATTAPGSAAAHKPGARGAAQSGGSSSGGSNTVAAIRQFAQSVGARHAAGARHAPGNLSVPAADPAAHRVANALNGHSHAHAIPGKPPRAQ